MPQLLLVTLILLVTPATLATDFAGYDLLIPIGGRAAGLGGSIWRTDVYITNTDRRTSVSVTTLAGDHIFQAEIPPLATIIIRDLTHSQGLGPVRIGATSPDAKLSARARIYNIGSAQGQYGQTVQAMPVTKLSRETYVPGMSGVNGNRTNAGIANPSSSPAAVSLGLYDELGDFQGGVSILVAPRSLYLLNDIFSHFDDVEHFDNAALQVRSNTGVYAYASVVRNDTGDADFIIGTGVDIDDRDAIIQPDCDDPADLRVTPFPSDGWVVTFVAGTPATSTTHALAEKYGFTPRNIYEDALQGFSAELTQDMIARLRCESVVRAIDENAFVPVP